MFFGLYCTYSIGEGIIMAVLTSRIMPHQKRLTAITVRLHAAEQRQHHEAVGFSGGFFAFGLTAVPHPHEPALGLEQFGERPVEFVSDDLLVDHVDAGEDQLVQLARSLLVSSICLLSRSRWRPMSRRRMRMESRKSAAHR